MILTKSIEKTAKIKYIYIYWSTETGLLQTLIGYSSSSAVGFSLESVNDLIPIYVVVLYPWRTVFDFDKLIPLLYNKPQTNS